MRPHRRRSALALVALVGLASGAPASESESPLRIGIMDSILKNRNENDVIAAMRVWAEAVARESGVDIEPRITVLRGLDEAVSAMREKRLEALTLSLATFAEFPSGLLGPPFLRDEINGTLFVEYALIAAVDGPIKTVGDLAGARLAVHDDADSDVALAWLSAQLVAAGRAGVRETVAKLELNEKASPAVLGVFFGRSDACLVRRSVFESTAELNPQVARRLAVIAYSEPIAPALFCYRADMPERPREQLFHEALRLHESVTGAQVLRVFRSDRMRELRGEDLDRSVAFYRRWTSAVLAQQGRKTARSAPGARR